MNINRFILLFVYTITSITMSAQNEVLTNQTVIDMIGLEFSDDVIVTKIGTSETKFDTSIQALKTLKEKGVSNNVIVAMMDAGKTKNSKNVTNSNIGIYYKTGEQYSYLYPSAFRGSASKTLGSATTPFVSNTRKKAIIDNAQSENIIKSNIPEFIFYFDKVAKHDSKSLDWCFSVASSPKEFILVKMIGKKDRRELNIGEIDVYSGKFIGIESEEVIYCTIEAINETTFKVKPSTTMRTGEYCFFYQGSAPQTYQGNTPIFDFSIPLDHKEENKYSEKQSVWINKDGYPKKVEVMRVVVKNDGIFYDLRPRNSWKIEEYAENECFPTKDEAINREYSGSYEEYENASTE